MRNLTRWCAAVHAECLASGRGMTAHEAITQFGNPSSARSAGTTLNCAVAEGWFRKVEEAEAVGPDRIKRQRYFALDKVPVARGRPVVERTSFFDGMRRVRSVFELGEWQ